MGRSIVVPRKKGNWQLLGVCAPTPGTDIPGATAQIPVPYRRRPWATHRLRPRLPPLPASSWPPGTTRRGTTATAAAAALPRRNSLASCRDLTRPISNSRRAFSKQALDDLRAHFTSLAAKSGTQGRAISRPIFLVSSHCAEVCSCDWIWVDLGSGF
jgi:hypothetical protein